MSYKVNGTRPTDIRTVAHCSDIGDQEKPWHLAGRCHSREADETELIALHNQMGTDEIDKLIADDTGLAPTEVGEVICNILSLSTNIGGKIDQGDLFHQGASVTELFVEDGDIAEIGSRPVGEFKYMGCSLSPHLKVLIVRNRTEGEGIFIPEGGVWSISRADANASFQDIRWSDDTAQLSAVLRERERKRARLSEA